jgi:hypothetical protein
VRVLPHAEQTPSDISMCIIDATVNPRLSDLIGGMVRSQKPISRLFGFRL